MALISQKLNGFCASLEVSYFFFKEQSIKTLVLHDLKSKVKTVILGFTIIIVGIFHSEPYNLKSITEESLKTE